MKYVSVTDPFDHEIPAADPRGEAPVAASRRRSRRLAAPTNPLLEQAFPSWARPPKQPAVGADAGFEAAFRAGAGLALLDQILRLDPPFAGALRQRLALGAATARAAQARHREDSSALRDAEHLAPIGARTSSAGRVHRLWRLFARGPTPLEDSTLRIAADLLGLSDAASFEGFADALRDLAADAETPLAAAAGAMKLLAGAPPTGADVSSAGDKPHVEIFALWLADLALVRRLGWDAPVPLLATTITHPSPRRGPSGKRPRPADADWARAMAGAYAMAARDALGLAGELSRRSQALLAAQPKLRAKSAGRVIELLLGDDAISPAAAARATKLSDRASRRLFDRLVELGAARELSGRPNFRLYGL
ncbi:MAG TPA: DUF1403 family protein [Methylocystis sp.]|jgi:hypothetical protein